MVRLGASRQWPRMAWAAYLTGYRGLKARPRSPSRERERRRRQQSTRRAARLNRARHGGYGIDTSCCGGGGGGAALLAAPADCRLSGAVSSRTVAVAAAVSHGSRCIAARRGSRRGSSPRSRSTWNSARPRLEPGPSRVRKFMMPAAGEENFAPRSESSAKMTGSRMAFASRG